MARRFYFTTGGCFLLAILLSLLLRDRANRVSTRDGSSAPVSTNHNSSPNIQRKADKNPLYTRIQNRLQQQRASKPPSLQPFDPRRLETDSDYRLVVWDYWISRELQTLRQAGVNEVIQISKLLEKYGIPKEFADEYVRRAYEDVTEVQRFRNFAEQSFDRKKHQDEKIPQFQELSEQERAQLLKENENHQSAVYNYWMDMAEAMKQFSISHFENESGITDPTFYHELYALEIKNLAAPLATNMAVNAKIWAQ